MSKKESNLTCRVSGGSIPKYSHTGDAGADLTASQKMLIPPRDRLLVTTGIHLEIPEGHVGLIWPRSGLAVKKGIDCGAGVIDSHYRGEVKVLLFNHSGPVTIHSDEGVFESTIFGIHLVIELLEHFGYELLVKFGLVI